MLLQAYNCTDAKYHASKTFYIPCSFKIWTIMALYSFLSFLILSNTYSFVILFLFVVLVLLPICWNLSFAALPCLLPLMNLASAKFAKPCFFIMCFKGFSCFFCDCKQKFLCSSYYLQNILTYYRLSLVESHLDWIQVSSSVLIKLFSIHCQEGD